MKQLLDKLFPTLSDELIIVITLIICLLVTASIALFLVKKLSPKTNISELVARTRSWWIMAAMFIGAVFISYDISYFFLAFLSFIAFRELYSSWLGLFGIRIQRGRPPCTVLGHIGYSYPILSCLYRVVWGIHHIHPRSYVPVIAITTGIERRYTRNH